MKLVTGRTGEPHVTSEQDRMLNQGVYGEEACILQTGKRLNPEVKTSNEIRIRDGAIVCQGALGCVETNTYDSVTIQNGNQGMNRVDLIVWRYRYDQEQDKESADWAVVQGTPMEGEAQRPDYTRGNIQEGDAVVEFPVYEVKLEGINITEVNVIAKEMPTIAELNRKLPACNEIYTGVANHAQYDIPDITPYDLLVIYGGPGTYANTSMVVPVASIVYKDDGQFALGVYQGSSTFWELEFNFPTSTKINIANYKNQSWTTPAIRKILGIKL